MTGDEGTLAAVIQTARVRKGFSQQAAARAAGVSRGQLANAEQGENVSVEFLQKLAPVLGLTQIPIGGGMTLTHGTPYDALQMLAALDVMAEQIEVMRAVATNFLVGSNEELFDSDAVAAFAAEHGVLNEEQATRATAATRRLASDRDTPSSDKKSRNASARGPRSQPKRRRNG